MKTKKSRAVDQRKYSRLVVDGAKQSPSRAMLRAVGFQDADFAEAADRRRLDLGQPHALQHAHQRARDRSASPARTRPAARACCSTPSRCRTASRWATRHALLAGVARSDRRLDRDRGRRRRLRRLRRDRRLRQEHAGLRDGDGAPEPARGVRLRRHHPARRQAPRHRLGVRSGGRPRRRPRVATRSCSKSSARRFPGPGSCGGMYTANTMASAIEALGLSLPNSSAQEAVGEREARRLPARRRRGRRAGRAGITPARHPHEEGVRERDHRDDRARRQHQRRAAPARDRACGQGQTGTTGLHADRQTRPVARRRASERPIFNVGAHRHRRNPAADETIARRRSCCTATA